MNYNSFCENKYINVKALTETWDSTEELPDPNDPLSILVYQSAYLLGKELLKEKEQNDKERTNAS